MAQLLNRYFGRADALAHLEAHAQRLRHAEDLVRKQLPSYLVRGCGVARIDEQRLVLRADNGAIATKLRQSLPSLRQSLARAGLMVSEIDVKVGLPPPPPTPRPPLSRSVPSSATHSMQTLLETLPDDSPLRTALQRFVRRNA